MAEAVDGKEKIIEYKREAERGQVLSRNVP